MADAPEIQVEIVYALPATQRLISLAVAPDTTARDLVLMSGLGDEFAELDTQHCPLGVFGKPVADDYVLRAGDRLEIYRPLINDPREARRKLAARGRTMKDRP